MSDRTTTFAKQLDELIRQGDLLSVAIQYECYGDKFKQQLNSKVGKDKIDEYIAVLPYFKRDYQAWYSEALSLVRQVLPQRLEDFKSYYEYPRVRKEITFQNYMIRDFLQGLRITRHDEIVADGTAAIPEFGQQLNIVKAAKATLQSVLIDLTKILQADLFDSELGSARSLAKSGYLRAAGAICGVVIEKHLRQLCDFHAVVIKKKNPVISDLNQGLRDKGILSISQWRFVQHLTDIRNLCDHAKGREPKEAEVDDLLSGTDKVLKTYF